MTTESKAAAPNFIRAIIDADLEANVHGGRVTTRFPPEPNGYLHIGHAKAICLNFGLARDYGGACHLRFDDTNPAKEDVEYVNSIMEDVRWLGFDWDDNLFHASDYFERMYELAVTLIGRGKAYVCSLSDEDARMVRGKLGQAGELSPFASRSVDENLDLFARMRAGEFPDGSHVLRARIDMSASNMKMRDPILYRIRHTPHDRTGDTWCIYPMYDYAHCLSDAFERITHSICTLEFENNRELYDWIIAETRVEWVPRQYEFARLHLGYTVMSKRKLLLLVNEGQVSGWDDPRMPTIAGLRRRGCTPEAIRSFCDMIGVAKANSLVDIGKLEYAIRDDLNHRAPRVMCVLHPLKVVLTNYEGEGEELDASYWPHDVPREGSRRVAFGRELFIDRGDFMEEPPPKYHRLAPGREVRLRYAYVIRCDEVVKDEKGEVVELRCTWLEDTRGGKTPDGRKVKGTIHWVSAEHSLAAEVRLFDRLFAVDQPDAVEGDFRDHLNPNSRVVVESARVEASLAHAAKGDRFQFERHGYFIADSEDFNATRPVFNRIVTLRDSWAKKTRPADVPPKMNEKVTIAAATKDKARPQKRSRSDFRHEARARDASLHARFESYQSELGLSESLSDALTGNRAVADFFDAARADHAAASVAKWMVNELFKELKERPFDELAFGPAQFAQLIRFVDSQELAARSAKTVLSEMVREGGDPEAIIERDGLRKLKDPVAIEKLVSEVLAENADAVQRYRAGQQSLRGFFVGQTIKKSGGRADPGLVHAALEKALQ